nr:MAG TPA: hypothetical protein [Caudoviricetes sp.]
MFACASFHFVFLVKEQIIATCQLVCIFATFA